MNSAFYLSCLAMITFFSTLSANELLQAPTVTSWEWGGYGVNAERDIQFDKNKTVFFLSPTLNFILQSPEIGTSNVLSKVGNMLIYIMTSAVKKFHAPNALKQLLTLGTH